MRPEHWLFTIPLRLRSLFRRELDDELRDHLERKTEEYVARGMTQEEAHRRARLDLEGIEQTKEKCCDARRVNWIQDFVQDLHFGLRMLRKTLGFTNVVILTLALGIQGVNIEVKQRGKLVWRRGWDSNPRNLSSPVVYCRLESRINKGDLHLKIWALPKRRFRSLKYGVGSSSSSSFSNGKKVPVATLHQFSTAALPSSVPLSISSISLWSHD